MISSGNQTSPQTNAAFVPGTKNVNDKNLVSKPKAEDDKIVKHINYLNSNAKTKIDTEAIDNVYSDQNLLFQVYSHPIKSMQKIKAPIPKSPTKTVE